MPAAKRTTRRGTAPRASKPRAKAPAKRAPRGPERSKPKSTIKQATRQGRAAGARRIDDELADGAALLARAERAVQMALARGAAEAEVYVEAGASLDVELENDRIATTGASRATGACVRLVRDGRLGFGYWSDDRDAAAAIDQALQQSRLAPARGFRFPGGAKPKALPGRWDPRIVGLEVGDAIGLAQELLAGAKEASPKSTLAGGGASLEFGAWAVANSAGVAAWDRATSCGAAASLVLQDGERAVSAGESRTLHTLRLDARAVAVEAGEVTESLRGPKPAKASGARDLVLKPDAAADLVSNLAVSAATGDDAMRGKTVWSAKLGEEVAAPLLDLTDDVTVPGAVGASPIDGDGLPTGRTPIIAGGVLRTFLFDAWDAHRHGQASTRSAVRGGFKARPETGTQHLVLSSRKATPFAKLVAGIDDGYLVDNVLGAHTANVTTGDFSVTAPNVWRIRKGAIEGPVSEVAIAGSLPDLLHRVDGVGKEAKAMDGARVPVVRFRGVSVSS